MLGNAFPVFSPVTMVKIVVGICWDRHGINSDNPGGKITVSLKMRFLMQLFGSGWLWESVAEVGHKQMGCSVPI